MSQVVSLDTIAVAAVGGSVAHELVTNYKTRKEDATSVLLPDISKKSIVFDETGELHILMIEPCSKDSLDKGEQIRHSTTVIASIPRIVIDESNVTTFSKEDHFCDKIVSIPLIESMDGAGSKIL